MLPRIVHDPTTHAVQIDDQDREREGDSFLGSFHSDVDSKIMERVALTVAQISLCITQKGRCRKQHLRVKIILSPKIKFSECPLAKNTV